MAKEKIQVAEEEVLALIHKMVARDNTKIEAVMEAATEGLRSYSKRVTEERNKKDLALSGAYVLLTKKGMRKESRLDWMKNIERLAMDKNRLCGSERDFIAARKKLEDEINNK